MTKKRARKLLMACGVSRNTANKALETIHKKHSSYEKFYTDFLILFGWVLQTILSD